MWRSSTHMAVCRCSASSAAMFASLILRRLAMHLLWARFHLTLMTSRTNQLKRTRVPLCKDKWSMDNRLEVKKQQSLRQTLRLRRRRKLRTQTLHRLTSVASSRVDTPLRKTFSVANVGQKRSQLMTSRFMNSKSSAKLEPQNRNCQNLVSNQQHLSDTYTNKALVLQKLRGSLRMRTTHPPTITTRLRLACKTRIHNNTQKPSTRMARKRSVY